MPRPLYLQRKSPWYPLDRRLGGPQSRSGRCGEEKNSQPPPGIEPWNPDSPAPIAFDSAEVKAVILTSESILNLHTHNFRISLFSAFLDPFKVRLVLIYSLWPIQTAMQQSLKARMRNPKQLCSMSLAPSLPKSFDSHQDIIISP
jgi:hypothetical protein